MALLRSTSWLAVLGVVACAPRGPSPASASSAARAPAPAASVAAKPLPPFTLLIDEVQGLGLYRDEDREAEELVYTWAVGAGLRVVPVEKSAETFDHARKGNDPSSGAPCGRPLARWRATERYLVALGAEGRLRTFVGCEHEARGCTLSVTATRSGSLLDDIELLELEAPFDAKAPWKDALTRALAALRPRDTKEGFGVGGLGMIGGALGGKVEARPARFHLEASPARSDDTRSDRQTDAGFLEGREPSALRACFGDGGGGASVLVTVEGAGRISRCESREGDDAASVCACSVLTREARATATWRGARVHVDLSVELASVVTPWNGLVTASTRTYLDPYRDTRGARLWRPLVSDRSIEAWDPPRDDDIARCFADLGGRGRVDTRVTVTFDARGHAVGVDLEPKQPLGEAQRACMKRVFARSVAPCPAVPSSTAKAAVLVLARTIGEPFRTPVP